MISAVKKKNKSHEDGLEESLSQHSEVSLNRGLRPLGGIYVSLHPCPSLILNHLCYYLVME